MSAINKFRIVGPRYKQQTRIYKDETFSFSSDEGPQNVIATAKNSFGKGVYLQVLFQAMIPKTPWSRGKNTVNHFFYADKKQFNPYTFYSCLEFYLASGRSLLVGIAITSRLNEKNDCEPVYTLFVREYEFSLFDPFTIDQIPLYNKQKDAPTPYADFMEYLKENKKEFFIYSENSKAKFYQHLESYGIIKKDWEQLIDINQYEGGVAHYFDDRKATTNNGLFSRMIIPAIEARLNDKENENHLINLFKNIASITKNLPELKRNASAYVEIKRHNDEVHHNLTDLMKEKEKYNIHLKNGLELVAAVKNEISALNMENKDHQNQLEEFYQLKQELKWEQENIKYIKKHEEHEELLGTIQSLKNLLSEKEAESITAHINQNHSVLQLQLRKWHEKENELQEVRRRIDAIEQSQEFRESKELLKQLEIQIHDEWDVTRKSIQRIQTECAAYENHVNEQKQVIGQQIREYNNQILDEGIKKGVIGESILGFEKDLEEPKKLYGEYFLHEMDNVLKNKRKELFGSNERHSQLKVDLENKQKAKTDYSNKLATIAAEITVLKNEEVNVKQNQERQETKEQTIISKVWKVLRSNPVEVVDVRKWMKTQAPVLKNKKEDMEIRLNQLNLEYYELAFEVKQNDKPFLITSEEVYKVKVLMNEKGIPVMYGDEYIKQQEQSEREELNRSHPLLKYGLLIPNHNKNFIDDLKKLDKEYFHAPVPIYWVNQLREPTHVPFMILDQVAADLSIHDNKLLERKQKLYSKGDEIRTEIDRTKEYLDQLTSLIAELESFDITDTSAELKNKYQALQKDCLEKVNYEDQLKKEISSIDRVISKLSESIKKHTITIENLKKENENLESWIKGKKKYEEEKQQQLQLSLKIQSLESKKASLEIQLIQLNDEYQGWKESRSEWNRSKDDLIEKVKEVIPVKYFDEIISQTPQRSMPIFNMEESSLNDCLNKWKASQKEMSAHNIELVKLRTSLNIYRKAVREEEHELSQLNGKWRKYPVPLESKIILKNKLDFTNKTVKAVESQTFEIKSDIKHSKKNQGRLINELNDMLQSFDKKFNKPPVLLNIENFLKANLEVEEAIKHNTRDIMETEDILKELKDRISEFTRLFERLDARIDSHNIAIDDLPQIYIQEKVKKEPEKTGDEWIQKYETYKNTMGMKKSGLQSIHRNKKEEFEKSDWALNIKELALKVYSDIDFEELDDAKAMLESLSMLAETEISEAENERNTAEEAKKEWVDHTCKYALQIVEHLRKMVKAMSINNRNGLKFPLVKLKGEKYLPRETDQIKGNIDDLFDHVIKEIFADYHEVNDVPLKVFKEKISIRNIMHAALNYQYPTLRLYRLHEENSFLYEPPKEEYYTEWETINESSKTDPSGSGGQLFSARTLILMMLTSFKRTNEDNSNWKLLITDNPFSVAVSDHIVDPILAIAEELKFQWIVVTPPELVKIELLQKFDMYYHLSAKAVNSGTDQVVSEVQYGYRNYKKSNRILREDKNPVYGGQVN
jgi:hypothetical protein